MPPFRDQPTQRFECIANFRDLGGHQARCGRRLRRGLLFRSGHLADATDSDIASLERLGLQRIFDFRTLGDIESEGADRMPPAAEHVRLPMPDPARREDIRALIEDNEHDGEGLERAFGNGQAAQMMIRSAAGLVRDRRDAYAHFFAELSRQGSLPALFHCSAGKDRAGWACSVVLAALDISEEQVIEQYLLSNRELESIRRRFRSRDREDWLELLQPLLEVRPEYIEASFGAVRADWGSFDRYLHEGLGISEEQRDRLKQSLLE